MATGTARSPKTLHNCMPTPKEFRKNAEDCLRLAHETDEIYAKMALIEMATEFRVGVADEGFGAGHGRYHRAAQEHHLPDRCEAFARRDQGADPAGQKARRAAAAILRAHRQPRRHDGSAVCPCQTVQPPPSTAAHFAHPVRLSPLSRLGRNDEPKERWYGPFFTVVNA
jgi:hypothetical protein